MSLLTSSIVGVGTSVRQAISQAMSALSLDGMLRGIVVNSDVVSYLESVAETWLPNLRPELRLVAGAIMTYNNDPTKWLQQALNTINGGTPINVDGIYGPETIAAVEKFQQTVVGLKVDGLAYKVTTPFIEMALAKLLTHPVTSQVIAEQTVVTAPSQVAKAA